MRALGATLGLLLAGCLEVPPKSLGNGEDPDADVGGTTGYRRQITIAGASVAAPLDAFPVLVRLPGDEALKSHAAEDGLDIVFRDAGGVLVPFEREEWDPATGELRAWVNPGAIAAGPDTVFFLHYGERGESDLSDPAAVWKDEFAMVWHLNEDPDEAIDSSGGGHAAVDATGSAELGEGYLGEAVVLDGGGDHIDFGSDLPAEVDAGQYLTVTAWVRYDALGMWSHFISKASTLSNRQGWALGIDSEYDFTVRAMDGAPTQRGWSAEAQPEPGAWHHFAMVYDGAQATSSERLRGFRDGVEYELSYEASIPGRFDARGGPLYIGCATWNSSYCIDGAVDEVHVSIAPRPPEWIAAEYANQVDGSTFLTVGEEESL